MVSSLQPNLQAGCEAIDESLRASALEPLRRHNYQRILARWNAVGIEAGCQVLDVGCAHGWFMEAAQKAGFQVVGVEPDRAIARLAQARGLDVRLGTFPDALPADLRFEVITFHDVFEHMPDLDRVLAACRAALNESGWLAITLPSSRGALFRTARWLSRLGVRGPLDRLWQVGFPSPHLTYFHPDCLARFVSRHGFREVHREPLPSIMRAGLWQRLRYDRSASLAVSAVQYVALSCLLPVLRALPSDISFQLFQRSDQ